MDVTNHVVNETVRVFAQDMLEKYEHMNEYGKSPQEIVEFATGFFNGLIDGSVKINKNHTQTVTIKSYAALIMDQFNKLSSEGKSPEEILLGVKYYLIGTLDGLNIKSGKLS